MRIANAGRHARKGLVAVAAWALATACLAGSAGLPATTSWTTTGAPSPTFKAAGLAGDAMSEDVRHVATWAVHSGDHGALPFVVVDKENGQLYVFDGAGRMRGTAPALVGAARGDHTVPGIGNRKISSILPEERTTPAGRFLARMGTGPSGEDLLWVDYEGAVAIHRVVTNVPKERRLQRLESRVARDRRITYGCINVPVKFYEAVIAPMFREAGGVVYVLPETRPAQEVFGSYEVRESVTTRAPSLLPVSQ
ncbi:hypothetical protein [Ramlibacter sp.]|uniref:hypothetical protein n=1 Tax=Ramlibacter sp. TaxID=1917967 RepID=UPI003D11ECD3